MVLALVYWQVKSIDCVDLSFLNEFIEVRQLTKWENLTITDNFIFSKVMENNPDLCRKIIEAIVTKTIVKYRQRLKFYGKNRWRTTRLYKIELNVLFCYF